MRIPRPDQGLALAAASAVLLALSGCTDASQAGEVAATSPTPDPTFAVDARLSDVAGTLPPGARARVKQEVATLLHDFLEGSVEGTHPLADPAAGLAAFEPDTRAAVGGTLAELGRMADGASVTVRDAVALVSVSSPRRAIAGATAWVDVRLQVHGPEGEAGAALSGQLLLTPTRAGWQVFGYDLQLDEPALAAEATATPDAPSPSDSSEVGR